MNLINMRDNRPGLRALTALPDSESVEKDMCAWISHETRRSPSLSWSWVIHKPLR